MIAAKKMLLAGRVATPFVRSGTFASDLDGWVQDSGSARVTNIVRTSPGAVRLEPSTMVFDYTLPAGLAQGLVVKFSIWSRVASTGPRSILRASYKIGAAEFVAGAEITNTGSFQQLTMNFKDGRKAEEIKIRLRTIIIDDVPSYIDDWRIEGTRS